MTIGTTMPFDELLMEADRLAGVGAFDEEIVCQYGESAFRARHCEQFRAKPSIDALFAASSLVVTHGGSTVAQLLMMRKPFVAFANPRGAGDHQRHFLERVAMVATISWSTDVTDLERLVLSRRAAGPATVSKSIPRARDLVLASIDSSAGRAHQ